MGHGTGSRIWSGGRHGTRTGIWSRIWTWARHGAGMARGRTGTDGYGPMGHGMGPQVSAIPVQWRCAQCYLKSEHQDHPGSGIRVEGVADRRKQQAEAMQAWRTTVQAAPATAPERLGVAHTNHEKAQEQMEKGTAAFKDPLCVF